MNSTVFSALVGRPFDTQRASSIWMDIVIGFQCIKIILFTLYQVFFALNKLHNFKVECLIAVLVISMLEMGITVFASSQIAAMSMKSVSQIYRTADVENIGVKEENLVDTWSFRKHDLNCLSFSGLIFAGCQENKAIPSSHGAITPMLCSHHLIIPFFASASKAEIGGI